MWFGTNEDEIESSFLGSFSLWYPPIVAFPLSTYSVKAIKLNEQTRKEGERSLQS